VQRRKRHAQAERRDSDTQKRRENQQNPRPDFHAKRNQQQDQRQRADAMDKQRVNQRGGMERLVWKVQALQEIRVLLQNPRATLERFGKNQPRNQPRAQMRHIGAAGHAPARLAHHRRKHQHVDADHENGMNHIPQRTEK